jgi:imidazolonepropionase-like amidohydrolase
MKVCVILLSFLLIMPASAQDEQSEVTAVKAGKILTMSGAPITDGIILIKDGKITDIGAGIEIPENTSVIDAGQKVVMPGLVDASGVPPVRGDLNEQSEEITPTIRISAALDSQSKALKRMIQTGITTLYVSPGLRNVIAGLGAVIKPTGKTPEEMVIKKDAALTVVMSMDSAYGNRIPRSQPPYNFYYRRPTTRMAIIWMLRKSFFDTQEYTKSEEKDDPDLEILASALDDKIPVRLNVRRAINIRTALKLADEYDFQLILDECTEGYKVAEEIAQKQVPVVLGPFYYYPGSSSQYREGREVNWNNAGILTKAGVKIALTSGAQARSIDLLTAAAFAVRHGMSRDKALKAITTTPAEILGVADKVGTLEKGKDADILILSGDPLKVTTRIEQVILNCKTVYKAE